MTTQEAAKLAGVSQQQLLRWQREGYLTPSSNGRQDTMRRLDWSDKDVAAAKDLKNQESSKSASEAFIDSMGGADFVASFTRARGLQGRLQSEEIAIAGPLGCRIIPIRSLTTFVLNTVGSPAVILTPEHIL